MAQENKPKSIFFAIADALRGNKKNIVSDLTSNTLLTNNPNANTGDNSVQNIQQQYLDVQSLKIAQDLYSKSVYYDSDRLSAYNDFRAMDLSPEISVALDIMSDECIAFDTVIPLLNGEKLTVEEIYNQKRNNFWVYSYNIKKKCVEPAMCPNVIFKGEQNVYEVSFDDDSVVKVTSEHLWLLKNTNDYIKTSDLKIGDSIQPFYTRISEKKDRIQGYEMILMDNGKWEYTHRIVKSKTYPTKKGVCHHVDFNKLNNTPENLDVMNYFEHQKLHASLNSKRWENEDFANKMKKVFSETNSKNGPYWSNPVWVNERKDKYKKSMAKLLKSLSTDERKEIYGRTNEQNGMFNNGHKITNDKNGRYLHEFKHEFSQEDIINAYALSKNMKDACVILNTNIEILRKSQAYKNLSINRWEDIEFKIKDITLDKIHQFCESHKDKFILERNFKKLCDHYNWHAKTVTQFFHKNGYNNWCDFVKPYKSRESCINRLKQLFVQTPPTKNGKISKTHFCQINKLSIKKIECLLLNSSLKTWTNFTASINHSIKSIKFIGKQKTYDLINVTDNNNYAILTSNGTGVFVHNCVTRNDKGQILTIYSENVRIKKILQDLFYKTLNIDYNLWFWTRELLKYGDNFIKLELDQKLGIYDCIQLPTGELHKEVGFDGNPQSVRYKWDISNMFFEDFQVAHLSLVSDGTKLPYGRSVLDPARKLWKQLQLAEDAMLVYRLVRAPERRIFYIEVGNMDPGDVKQYIESIKRELKKQPVVDQRQGNVNLKFNLLSFEEDYFMPIRGDKASRIETLPGACLSLDTKIPLLDGRTLTLDEIITEYESGQKLEIYSINPKTGEILPGPITWAGVTRKNTQVVKLTFDNGQYIICTPDHKFPNKKGELICAENLTNENIWGFIENDEHEIWDDEISCYVSKSSIYKKFTEPAEKEFYLGFEIRSDVKIISVEFLENSIDTGTITVDGNEIFHNFHNFALTCGVFTMNSNLGDIMDIEYLQNKLFTAIKVPKTYLNYGEALPGGSTLSQADLRFSRTINRFQEAIVLELRRIANIHLFILGHEDDMDNFSLSLTNPSTQQELLKLETMKARGDVFKEMYSSDVTSPVSYTWAMEYILGFSKAEIKTILRQKKFERKMFNEMERAHEEYMDTGMFTELDRKFRKPGFDPNTDISGDEEGKSDDMGGGDGGFGGGSSLGMGDFGGDMGGGSEPFDGAGDTGDSTPDLGADPNSPPTPGSEMSDEQPEDDETLKENNLIKNNQKINHRTKKLLEGLDRFIKKLEK